ncbi:MAG: signal peptidase II [Paludibacteraceae bacterium]|nr:signal peptidase II [Paludibacteraceae bacterium]
MKRQDKQRLWIGLTIAVVLIIDQAVKFYIKLNFRLDEQVELLPFLKICFVENPGMAFGMEWLPKWTLTLLRIILVVFLAWYLHRLLKQKTVRTGYLVTLSLIIAGAVGNIIDCLFYGIIFDQSTFTSVATLFPADGGYGSFFCGKVVDMIQLPLINNAAGDVVFFRPVFNIADAAITTAVFMLILFFRKDMDSSLNTKEDPSATL